MGLFSRRTHTTAHSRFYRKDRDRVAGGYKAALANPNTTSDGRKHAKHQLYSMGKSSHVSFMTKIKRTLGIRSTPRKKREAHNNARRTGHTTTRSRRKY